MTPTLLLATLGFGAGALGVLLCWGGLPGSLPNPARARSGRKVAPPTLAVAAAVGVGTVLLTRWPAAGILAGVAAGCLPGLLGSTASSKTTERVEAVAIWTELLRDTLAASAGLGQAIVATAGLSPRPIREPVMALAERLISGVAMEDALRSFAAEVDHPSADLVVCALLLAASAQSQKLAELLGALAESCREDVAMRLRVESSRAASRSGVRTVVVFSLAFAGLLFLLAHAYLSPFGSPTGQVILLVIGALYAGGLGLMVRLVRPPAPIRLLNPERAL
ncbi:MAG TPA: type II secretion system F family protein [Acidimicrobiales bacterium]|nr:type II secretion system F family protein [Acidimicrobiales bacterium]